MRVKELLAQNKVFLAPMAGVTDLPFRVICKSMGCGLTYTEMVSAKGLHYGGATRELLAIAPQETPAAVQLFGREPEIMAGQAQRLCGELGDRLALIDINMGCPAHKITANGEGSALMREPEQAARVIAAVAGASRVPVTVKFRKGWDEDSVNAVEFALMAQENGAAMVTVHGRTRQQLYGGKADWDIIGRVKRAVKIPVIGNGDIFEPPDALEMLAVTGCDGVMVARGAQGNPWLLAGIKAALEGKEWIPPTALERVQTALGHARSAAEFKGPHGIVEMRKHIGWYIKGIPGAARLRAGINAVTTLEELEQMLKSGLLR